MIEGLSRKLPLRADGQIGDVVLFSSSYYQAAYNCIVRVDIVEKKKEKRRYLEPYAIPGQRSNQVSYYDNWELVACEFVIYPWMEKM